MMFSRFATASLRATTVRAYSVSTHLNAKVAVLGAAGGIGQVRTQALYVNNAEAGHKQQEGAYCNLFVWLY